jgi:arylsulfatase A-like enzyme
MASALAAMTVLCGLASAAWAAGPPNVLLLTLDTTRADALGAFGGRGARTPGLDALAARGVRFTQAIASTPLTLPAHASLFTGLTPPEHGIEVNGTTVLADNIPTLAGVFSSRGYATAGFVASRVLGRQFGLGRGFGHYDDRVHDESIDEEQAGERPAREMTDAALEWLQKRPGGKPLFLWVHYYDPHIPNRPADADPKASAAEAYAGEVTAMDREIGRLLSALPGGAERWVIAAVGDHGESLGEHGEVDHGIFLYHATLHVPLILAGPGVPRGREIREAVATRRLASTLLRTAGLKKAAAPFGPSLPGLPGVSEPVGTAGGGPIPIYLACRYPLTAYGWSPLEGMFDGRFKLIVAPRPELYDLAADPKETRNLLDDPRADREPARRLKQALAATRKSFRIHPAAPADPELTRALESLGYLSGSGASGKGVLDPKDGVLLLADFAAAWDLAVRKNWQAAAAKLKDLIRKSPGNVRFLTALATVQLNGGEGDAAIATYRQAIRENPRRDESHFLLANAYARLGRGAEAREEFEVALTLSPRSFPAWWGLIGLAEKEESPAEVRALLTRAVAAGIRSASIEKKLAEIGAKAGNAVVGRKP